MTTEQPEMKVELIEGADNMPRYSVSGITTNNTSVGICTRSADLGDLPVYQGRELHVGFGSRSFLAVGPSA